MMHYRGQAVQYALHDRKADTYALIDAAGDCVVELKAREFLSLPNRNNLEVRSGRYRAAGSKDQRGADRKSRDTRRDDPLDALLYATSPCWPGAGAGVVTNAKPGKSPSLTARGIGLINQKMMQAFIFGQPTLISQGLDFAESERPALKRDGIVAGEIVGYRCWRIEKGWLRSVYQSDVWKPGCVLEGRELGDWDSRGIHAWKDAASKEYSDYIRSYLNGVDSLKRMIFSHSRETNPQPAMVTGTVFLWGDVVEHERGWRAEFARVRSLDWLYPDETMMGREPQVLDDLLRLYGVA